MSISDQQRAVTEKLSKKPNLLDAETALAQVVPPELEKELSQTQNVEVLQEKALQMLVPEPETPLYMRNPGPPPPVPRNFDLYNAGGSSYRLTKTQFGLNNNGLLRIVALLGVILVIALLVIKPQLRSGDGVPAKVAQAPTPTVKMIVSYLAPAEQYAIVVAPEGIVSEEPRAGSIKVQGLKQYTYIGLQRKTNTDWYELKGGFGWISGESVKIFGSEEAAWSFKREVEKTPAPTES